MGDLIAVAVLVGGIFWVLGYWGSRWSDTWSNNRR